MPDFKKSFNFFLLLFVMLFFSLILVSAVQIQLSKESYNAGETLIARVDADFLNSLSSSNVFFYRGHVLINVIYDAIFSNNTFFVYAITPDSARDYTIAIKNVKYKENGIAKETGISKNFSVSSEKADFYVTPGFILTEGNFNIRAVNKKENYTSIKASFQNIQQNISLSPLGYKLISLSAKDINIFSIIYLSLEGEKTSYSVPVLVYPAAQTTAGTNASNETNVSTTNISQGINASASNYTNETNISAANVSQGTNASVQPNAQAYQAQEALKFNPGSIIELSLIQEQLPIILPISLMNLHAETITDISLSYDKTLEGIISIAPGFIESIEPASSQNLELTINQIDEEGFFNGSIYAKAGSGNFSAVFYLEINITKDYSNLDSLEIATEEACNADYETLCQSNEFCVNATGRYTSEGFCCPEGGICKKLEQEKPKSSSNTKIIGFAILFLVIIIALLLFLKFKKAKKKDIGDVYKKAEEKYAKEPRAG